MGVRLEQVADHYRRLGTRNDDGGLGADTETLPSLAVGLARCWVWTLSTTTATMVVTVTITQAKKPVMMMMMMTKEKTN